MPKNRPVRSQMTGKVPSMSPRRAIMDHHPDPTFSKPHSTGGGGIPLVFAVTLGKSAATRLPPTTLGGGVQKPRASRKR